MENAPREGQFFLKRAILKEVSEMSEDMYRAFIKTNHNGVQFK